MAIKHLDIRNECVVGNKVRCKEYVDNRGIGKGEFVDKKNSKK